MKEQETLGVNWAELHGWLLVNLSNLVNLKDIWSVFTLWDEKLHIALTFQHVSPF